MNDIAGNYQQILKQIPQNINLVVVSKTKPVEDIMEVYQAGHRIFGESKAQELVAKYEQLPSDIQWHMVGHLQSNKVKYIAPFINLIHSVDSLKLLKVINKEAKKNDRVIDCLIQMHIAEEETKFGFNIDEVNALLESEAYKQMKNIRIKGLMCMATYTENTAQIEREFEMLIQYFEFIKRKYFSEDSEFCEKSMGMSDDYHIAIKKGSTLIRLGTIIFGQR